MYLLMKTDEALYTVVYMKRCVYLHAIIIFLFPKLAKYFRQYGFSIYEEFSTISNER